MSKPPPANTWVSLITGCSSGIGLALARELEARGQRCFATARRPEALERLRSEGLEAVHLDVLDAQSVRAAVDTVVERAGRIDLLVNNAGQGLFGPLPEVALERVDALFATNVRGPLTVTQAVVPVMARQGWGRIANVGSMVGVVPTPYTGVYCATKAALHTMSEVLRMEVEPLGIDVVVVQPGAVRSRVADNAPVDLDLYRAPSSLYRRVADRIEDRSRASQARPMAAAVFAHKLAHALLRRRAPRTVRIGRGIGFMPLLMNMPGSLRDRIFARVFGLDRLAATRARRNERHVA